MPMDIEDMKKDRKKILQTEKKERIYKKAIPEVKNNIK